MPKLTARRFQTILFVLTFSNLPHRAAYWLLYTVEKMPICHLGLTHQVTLSAVHVPLFVALFKENLRTRKRY
ncbi:MAG: hypothetical protein ACJAXS_000894 [Colwellia sp.]|jgi:hypothetical protein